MMDDLAKGTGVELWANPGIAPAGYFDLQKGAQVFHVLDERGNICCDMTVCYFKLGNSVAAFEIRHDSSLDALKVSAEKIISELKDFASRSNSGGLNATPTA